MTTLRPLEITARAKFYNCQADYRIAQLAYDQAVDNARQATQVLDNARQGLQIACKNLDYASRSMAAAFLQEPQPNK